MVAGIVGYFAFAALPWLVPYHASLLAFVEVLQPLLIFAMLFLSFCRVDLKDIRPCRWHAWLLAIQAGAFIAIGLILIAMPHSSLRIVLEGAMLCLICPTATAAAVITRKLNGDLGHITTYTILINLVCTLLIPVMVPLVHPSASMDVTHAMLLIMGKVFPLLLLPLILAILLRKLLPKAHAAILRWTDLSFYIWAFSLALAIAVTVRSIVHSSITAETAIGLVVVSLLACVLQFWAGRKIGARYSDTVTAGQALGQKNTVFVIWLGYTFFSPVTAIVGGFYSIWHNIANSYQLYTHSRRHSLPLQGQT